MIIPTKQLANGFTMPVFGLGTWLIGGARTPDPHNDDAGDIQAIQTAIEMGITHIDTAAMYAGGHAEELIGKATRGMDRKTLFITSKVPYESLAYADVIKSAEESLRRLQMEYFDLFLVHRPNPSIAIAETMRGMDELVSRGLTKYIGVCNFTVERFQAAQAATKNKLVVNQLHYNLLSREPERKGLVKFCQENDVFLEAWRPIQEGMLTHIDTEIIDEMCQKYYKTPAQIAINWLIMQKNVVTISKMRGQEHVQENLGALDWELSPEDIAKLDKEFPKQQNVSDSVPLI